MCIVQAPAATAGSQGTYVRKETQYAWECIQKECQKVLAMLLQGQTAGTAAGAESKGDSSCTSKALDSCNRLSDSSNVLD